MLYIQSQTQESLWGVWQIEETNDQLFAMLENRLELEANIFSLRSPMRISERLAVRALIKQLTGEEFNIAYHDSGKPYLRNEQYKISISHTTGFVAVYMHKTKKVGIDIEKISDKVMRIRKRFISPHEYIDPTKELIHLLLHWSAKETLYKILEIEGLSFQNELRIGCFEPENEGSFVAHALVVAEEEYKINYRVDSNFVLTMSEH